MYLRPLSRAVFYPFQNAITRQSGRVNATAQVADDLLCGSHLEFEADDGRTLVLPEAGEDFAGDTEVGVSPSEGFVRIREGEADPAEFPENAPGFGHGPILHLTEPSFHCHDHNLASGDRFCFAIVTR